MRLQGLRREAAYISGGYCSNDNEEGQCTDVEQTQNIVYEHVEEIWAEDRGEYLISLFAMFPYTTMHYGVSPEFIDRTFLNHMHRCSSVYVCGCLND